jgi:hypothetical protein
MYFVTFAGTSFSITTINRTCASPPLVPLGGTHSIAGEGLGVSHYGRGDKHSGTLGIYVLCAFTDFSCLGRASVLWGGGWGGGSTLPEEPPPPVPRHRTQHSKYNQSTSDANHIRQGAPFSIQCCQLFAVLFQPVQKKDSATEEKNRPPSSL